MRQTEKIKREKIKKNKVEYTKAEYSGDPLTGKVSSIKGRERRTKVLT